MAINFLNDVDLNKNELQNAVVQNLATAPSSPVEGQLYFDTTGGDKNLYVYNGSSFVSATSAVGNNFSTVAVSGQSDVVADQSGDTLTFAGTSNKTASSIKTYFCRQSKNSYIRSQTFQTSGKKSSHRGSGGGGGAHVRVFIDRETLESHPIHWVKPMMLL